jgi:hypothetical protein
MSTDTARPAQYRRQLCDAISAGNEGRGEIVARLARMPLEDFRTVSPQTLAMVGVAGLAELAKQRADLSAIAPKALATPTRFEAAVFRPPRRRRHLFLSVAIWMLVPTTLGLLGDLARPLLSASMKPHVMPSSVLNWPECPRLDGLVDGCLYPTGGPQMTLDRAAGHLKLPAEQLYRVNRHLKDFPQAALPAGTTIIIWRGTRKLQEQ